MTASEEAESATITDHAIAQIGKHCGFSWRSA